MRKSAGIRIFFGVMLALGFISAGIEEKRKKNGTCNKPGIRNVIKEAVNKVNGTPLFETLSLGSFIGYKPVSSH